MKLNPWEQHTACTIIDGVPLSPYTSWRRTDEYGTDVVRVDAEGLDESMCWVWHVGDKWQSKPTLEEAQKSADEHLQGLGWEFCSTRSGVSNERLADEIIARLNALCTDDHVREAIEALIEHRVPVHKSLGDHPTLQVVETNGKDNTDANEKADRAFFKADLAPHFTLGFLGLLNGLVGVIGGDGPRAAWGLVAASYDDNTGRLVRFLRTVENP